MVVVSRCDVLNNAMIVHCWGGKQKAAYIQIEADFDEYDNDVY